MTESSQSYVILPNDGSNLGKKTGSVQKVIGADTVHIPQVVTERFHKVTGVYRAASSAVVSVSATAHNGTTTGFLWAVLDPSATVAARLRKFRVEMNHSATTTMPTNPVFTLRKFIYTGTPTGAALAGTSNDSAYAINQLDIRTAVTGLTPTLDNGMLGTSIVPALHNVTAAGIVTVPNSQHDLVDIGAVEDEWPMIRPGEGIVFYQSVAGTTADTRRISYQFMWDEVNV